MNAAEQLSYGRHAAKCSLGRHCDRWAIGENDYRCINRMHLSDDLPTRGKHRVKDILEAGQVYYQTWCKDFVRVFAIESDPGMCGVEPL